MKSPCFLPSLLPLLLNKAEIVSAFQNASPSNSSFYNGTRFALLLYCFIIKKTPPHKNGTGVFPVVPPNLVNYLVELEGIEPSASSMPRKRAPAAPQPHIYPLIFRHLTLPALPVRLTFTDTAPGRVQPRQEPPARTPFNRFSEGLPEKFTTPVPCI